MPYPKRERLDTTNSETSAKAPTSPKIAPIMAPRTPSTSGGAPAIRKSVKPLWGNRTGGLPTAPTMTLPQAQEQLKGLSTQIKQRFDTAIKQNPELAKRNPRFFRAYQEFPEGIVTMMARRVHNDQIVGRGPVADYMDYLEGLK